MSPEERETEADRRASAALAARVTAAQRRHRRMSHEEARLHGMASLRLLVANFNGCHETFLDAFTARELLKLHEAHQRCIWDFPPDQWAPRQVFEALRGIVPQWDPVTEAPKYDPKNRKKGKR